MTKTKLYKTVSISKECHQMLKEISVKEKQSVKEWIEWVIKKGYETYKR